jgi:hypothetical protein
VKRKLDMGERSEINKIESKTIGYENTIAYAAFSRNLPEKFDFFKTNCLLDLDLF